MTVKKKKKFNTDMSSITHKVIIILKWCYFMYESLIHESLVIREKTVFPFTH